MKNFVRSKFCKTPDECAYVIEELRLSFTTQKCQNNINKINEVFTVTNANAKANGQ